MKSLFTLLHEINLADRGLEYLRSCSLHGDLEFKAILGEVFLQNGNLEAAQEYLLQSRKSRETYLLTLELLLWISEWVVERESKCQRISCSNRPDS